MIAFMPVVTILVRPSPCFFNTKWLAAAQSFARYRIGYDGKIRMSDRAGPSQLDLSVTFDFRTLGRFAGPRRLRFYAVSDEDVRS